MVSTRDARRRINLAQSLAEPIMKALAHVARRSQAREPDHRKRSGGLAPWQLRRAKDMFLADLRKNLSLQFVASACRVGNPRYGFGVGAKGIKRMAVSRATSSADRNGPSNGP